MMDRSCQTSAQIKFFLPGRRHGFVCYRHVGLLVDRFQYPGFILITERVEHNNAQSCCISEKWGR